MNRWEGRTWSTPMAERNAGLSWREWQEWQSRHIENGSCLEQRRPFTEQEIACLQFLRWYYDEHRLAS